MNSDLRPREPGKPAAASGKARRFRILDRHLCRLVPWLLCLGLSGCVNIGYYHQLAAGQLQLLRQREPIARVVSDQRRDPELRQRLAMVLQARRFASRTLQLPDNRSYLSYVELDRPYVLWNLMATPEFSVEAIAHCVPLAGCVAYRGYFRQALAAAAAQRLRAQGLDVWIGGVDAYSTLGWFADPLFSSMLRRDDEQLAGLLFHELAHQQVYVPGDTAFNESYASFVARQGLQAWRRQRGLPPADELAERRQTAFVMLMLQTRGALRQLYASPRSAQAMREAKAEAFGQLRAKYQRLRRKGQVPDYDHFMSGPLNNASLLPFALYDQWVPAFAQLFTLTGGDWVAFHDAVQQLGSAPAAQRHSRLEVLLRQAGQQGRGP